MKAIRALTALFLAILPSALASPTADQIIARLVERSADPDFVQRKSAFAYQRTSRVDYFDEKGAVKKNSVRVYEVAPVDGKPVTKLIQINGRPASETDDKRRSAARQTGDKSRGLTLTEDLLSRYKYTLRGDETLNGRPAWILDFVPKPELENDAFFDRLINAMTGTFWVDQEDYEMVKADIHLGQKVAFFGGLAGAIEKLDLQIIQKRLDSALWLTEGLSLDFSGRKLFSPIKFRCLETCSEFRKVPAQHASN